MAEDLGDPAEDMPHKHEVEVVAVEEGVVVHVQEHAQVVSQDYQY